MKVLFMHAKKVVLTILLLVIMLLLVLNPNQYMQSVSTGLLLWLNSVLPALFPFFFFSSILIQAHLIDPIGKKLNRLTSKLFHTPGSSGIIYLISIISGYPVGAKITSEMYKEKVFTTSEVTRINAFASTSGPLFIVGAVGVGMLFNHTFGIILLLSHYLGAICNGILYRNLNYSKRDTQIQSTPQSNENVLSKSMYDSIISILLVGGYIAIFFIIADILNNLGITQFFANILSIFGISNDVSIGIVNGIIEVTRGCNDLSITTLSPYILLPLICTLISFGGISIHFQALSFLKKCHMRTSTFLLQKFTQSIISGAICLILTLIFI